MNQIFIEATSYKRQNGKWIPRAVLFVDEGDQTRAVPYAWYSQECDSKDGADLCARFGAKQMMIRNGYERILPTKTQPTYHNS